MYKFFFIGLYCLCINAVVGQQRELDTWINVTHEVNQLTFEDKTIQQKLERALLGSQKEFSDEFEYYRYFHLYVESDTSCQLLEFRLSNYPYKSEDLIGFFPLKQYLVFVHNELPAFLKVKDVKKSFSYTEWKIGNFTIREDDTPCWVIKYRDHSLKVLRNPKGEVEF